MKGCTALFVIAAAAAKSRQSCPTLCDPIDGSPTGSSVPEILQARILEWVAISFSNKPQWTLNISNKIKWLKVLNVLRSFQTIPNSTINCRYWTNVQNPYSISSAVKRRSLSCLIISQWYRKTGFPLGC